MLRCVLQYVAGCNSEISRFILGANEDLAPEHIRFLCAKKTYQKGTSWKKILQSWSQLCTEVRQALVLWGLSAISGYGKARHNIRKTKLRFKTHHNPLRVDLNPRISKICASWMTVWNISANYVLVPLKFNLNWNIWNPFLKTSPLDFSGQRLGNTSLVVFLRFHSFSQVVKWPEFVRLYTTNSFCV